MPANTANLNLEQDAQVGSTQPISYYPASFSNATPSHRVIDIVPYVRFGVLPKATKGRPIDLLFTKSVPQTHYGIASKGLVWRILHLLGNAVIFLLLAMTTIASFGLPYGYYCCYRLQPSREKEQEASITQQQPVLEQWLLTLKRLRSQWESFFTLSVGVLPVILPMISAYPIQRCSWPFLLSVVALLSGLTTLVITSLYRCHSDAFRHQKASRAWCEASLSGWDAPLAKGFWVLVSLPTIWLLYLMTTLVTSIVFAFWEQTSTEKSLDSLCLPWHVNIFRATVLTLVCTASAHLIFIVSVLLFRIE